jgi:gliding motility-associated-like protein
VKNFLLFLLLFGSVSFSILNAQSSCLDASPFCTGTTYTFPNETNLVDLGPNGCLDGTNMCGGGSQESTPNSAWYYMEIDQAGAMTFQISQQDAAGSALDVDFQLWGPYTSLSSGCGTGTFPVGNAIQAGFSSSNTETAAIGAQGGFNDINCDYNGCDGETTPPPAQVGEVYIILLSNWSNQPGNITFSQTGGSGSADCSFTCGVNLSATPSSCSSNTYTLDGVLTITGSQGVSTPNSGTVTISSSCGGTPQVFTITSNSSNFPYSIPNLPANGTSCTVTATFSDPSFTSCNASQTYNAPSACNPICDITSVTATPTACNGSNQYDLSGTVNFTNPPTTGTLTVTNSCGTTLSFNPPFNNSVNYDFTGLTANGNSCSVTATFTANNSCTDFANYNAPSACQSTSGCNIAQINAAMAGAGFQPLNVSGYPCALYFYNPNTTNSWNTAQSQANAVGANLLTVCSLAENNAVWNAAQVAGISGGLWIGYTDQASEGNWIWQDGSTCTFTNWNTSEPSNSSCIGSSDGEDGAVIQMSNGKWNDVYLGPTGLCLSPASYASIVKVNLCPIVSSPTPNIVCLGSSVELTANTILGSNPYTYTWSSPATTQIGTGSPFEYFPTGNATVTVESVDQYGCTATTTVNVTTQTCNTPTCVQNPFCSGALTYPAGTGQTDAHITDPNNDYGCLFNTITNEYQTPNPAWYYMEVASPGDLSIGISNSANVDVDFIMYGPFANLNQVNSNCNNFGNGTTTNTIVDCSFSGNANESADVSNVQTGEVYVLLITNYSDMPTNITFQNSGTASTDCSIVTNCSITDFTGTTTSCTGGLYDVTGTITYSNPPTSGTLTISNDCGGNQIVLNAPFGTSVNYSFTGLSADGNPCLITASFSATTCSGSFNYTAPSCSCPADVGTYNVTNNGTVANQNLPIKLCYGNQLNITSNGNWIPPNETTGGTNPNPPTYTKGIYWLIYSCPPTLALTPADAAANNDSIIGDPCFVGVIAGTPSWSDANNLSVINSFPSGTFTNNTVYYVPITMYDTINGYYSYVIEPALMCYDLGSPIAVQYLPDITYTSTFNCANGTATVTLNGGSAQINGTNFNVVPGSLLPNTATFVNSSTGNGGSIVIGNLTTGNYSFDIVDDAGCPKAITGNFIGPQSADISYSKEVYCLNNPNEIPTMSGTSGGTYTSGSGVNLNSTTGEINFENSTPGNYTITYTTPGPICPATATYDLTIEDFPIVDGGTDQTLCAGTPVILSANGADIYDWNLGVQNEVPYLPNLGETEFYVVGSTLAGCEGYDTVVVTVIDDCNPEEEVVLWVPNTFTPDGDQYNQTFKPIFYSGYDPFGYELYIYNRWGELIFESKEVNVGWDGSYFKGRKVVEGTYTWKIRFKLMNNDEKRTVVGHVNILR